jgi:hypothetical protein
MLTSRHYRVDEPSIVSETIDSEAVILDLRLGIYYSTRGTGAAIWAGLEGGASVDAIAEHLAAAFPDQAASAHDLTEAFVAELIEQRLIVPDDVPHSVAVPLPELVGLFAAPKLERYSDMEDLLLLDPIHDVELVGWPARKSSNNLG